MRLKKTFIGIAALIAIMAAAFFIYVGIFYKADENANAVANGPGIGYTIVEQNGKLVFVPEKIE